MKQTFTKIQKSIVFILFNIVAVAVILLLCEGLASLMLVIRHTTLTPPVAERRYTRYDAELGWVSEPNLTIKDMYGPGLDLQTNAQGFRDSRDFTPDIPPGQKRLICSGDSFTLGYGVDNYNNWCALLDAINPHWQTVNMGQGGYGFDQAYLWYQRDGLKLAHNVHLFAFITRDFERMQQPEFLGYGKPLLKIRDDALIVTNVPVPQRAFYVPWLTQNSEALKQLKLVQLFAPLIPPAAATTEPAAAPPQVVTRIIEDLQRLNRAADSTLVLVYLPTWGDYDPAQSAATDAWRAHLRRVAETHDILFFDLIEDFRQLPADQIYTLFLHENQVDFPAAAGHYSVRGNEFVAQNLYDRLTAHGQ
jgi:hypothetical protein